MPVAAMVLGARVEVAAALLPRVFNLCRHAQAQAVALALDQPLPPGGDEILRDHLLKLFVSWPGLLGQGARKLPADWATDPAAVRSAVFGPAGVPARPAEMMDLLASDHGAAPVLRAIDRAFPVREAVTAALPFAGVRNLWTGAPIENSPAARQAHRPALQALEAAHGRGPLWRAAARLFDIAALLDEGLPPPESPARGEALVQATRGLYGLRLKSEGGIVTAFARVTPTDSLLAPGGVLAQSLASLDAARAGQAALVLDILDPCSPVTLTREVEHA
ncbi:hydrogenase expression/formation protein HupK [Pararhodobacter aggregans]|uniref:hydrogenase expression/formation protein HupK n=1 Tax=Pararhodobacter aggregans TaxID=404875 RepID=UPI003A8E4781